MIEGGTSGNVVPGHCGIVAEARSLDADRAAEVAGEMSEACAWGASEHGCDVDVSVEELFRGYKIPTSSRCAGAGRGGTAAGRPRAGPDRDRRRQRRQRADRRRLRLRPARQRHRGDPHRRTSRVTARNLDTMLEVCEGIVAEAGARARSVSGRLKLRRGVVVDEDPLTVEVDGERRPAWADRRCWARCARATRSSSTSPPSTSGSARAASTSSTSTSPAASRAGGRARST